MANTYVGLFSSSESILILLVWLSITKLSGFLMFSIDTLMTNKRTSIFDSNESK